MSVITSIKFENQESSRLIDTVNDKPIKNVILNGEEIPFAKVQNLSCDSVTEISNALNVPLGYLDIEGKNPSKNIPSFASPSFTEVEKGAYVKSYTKNFFSIDNVEHKQQVELTKINENNFTITTNGQNVVAFVQTMQKGVPAGQYTLKYKMKFENAPDNPRANEILVWSVKDGVAKILAVFTHPNNDSEYSKTLNFPTCDGIRISFYACTNATTYNNYKLTMENVSLTEKTDTEFSLYGGDDLVKIPKEISIDGRALDIHFLGVNGNRDMLKLKGDKTLKYYKATDVIILDGNEQWSEIEIDDGITYFTPHLGQLNEQGLCSHFPIYTNAEQTDYFKVREDGIIFKSSAHQTLEQFVNALKEESAKLTPVMVVIATDVSVWDLSNYDFAKDLYSLTTKEELCKIRVYQDKQSLPFALSYFRYKH